MFKRLMILGIAGLAFVLGANYLLVQGVNQEVIRPQDEREPRDPKYHEPLEHGAEPTASTNYIPAYYSFLQIARGKGPLPRRARRFTSRRWLRSAGVMSCEGKLKSESKLET